MVQPPEPENPETPNKIIYVSSSIDLYPTEIYKVICFLQWIHKMKIPIIFFIRPETRYQLLEIGINDSPNILFIEYVPEDNSYLYKYCMENKDTINLPSQRNATKDTFEYILSGHLKHELLENAIEYIPPLFPNATHMAWLDVSTVDILKGDEKTENATVFLSWFSSMPYFKPSVLAFPGCWNKIEGSPETAAKTVIESVHWRFCGLYFMGDMDSVKRFLCLYKTHIYSFLETYHILIWDFNFWAWLENISGEKIDWYRGDHNDSLFYCSADVYTYPLTIRDSRTYPYIDIPQFLPMSASYLYDETEKRHLLNTRYVNYWIYPNGCYHFYHPDKLIETKNVFSELSLEKSPDDVLTPINYTVMNENIGIPEKRTGISTGIEDIRIFKMNGITKFIASSIGYGQENKCQIVIGNYNIETADITQGELIHSPDENRNAHYEKNWIPVVQSKPDKPNEDELYILYKWSPIQIGKIIVDENENKRLQIIRAYSMSNPIFSKIRGSTTFIPWKPNPEDSIAGSFLLGVVHYSEEHSPRHYYHMLIMFDADLRPVKYSRPFYFEKIGVEFCIGFTIINDIYTFWISRHDRDPLCIRANQKSIPLCCDF